MNKPDPHEPTGRDVEESLKRLREIEPPHESSILNRETVADEIAKANAMSSMLAPKPDPIWRRSVGVPMPVFVAATALLVLLSVAQFRSGQGNEPTPSQPTRKGTGNSSQLEQSTGLAKVQQTKQNTPSYYRSQSEVYVCGVGTLRTETRYIEKESE